MKEIEFLNLYRTRYLGILDEYTKLVKGFSNLKHSELFDKTMEYSAEISYKGNILISQLMNENRLDHELEIKEVFDSIPIESFLFKKAFSIILECNKHYQATIDSFLLEVDHRDSLIENGQ